MTFVRREIRTMFALNQLDDERVISVRSHVLHKFARQCYSMINIEHIEELIRVMHRDRFDFERQLEI